MSDRKLVKDRFDCLTYDLEYKTVDEAIEYLKQGKQKVLSNPIYTSAEIAIYPGDPYDDSDKEYMYIVGIRYENDKEYSERLKREEEDKARREEYEKKQFEFLKKKYEANKC